jgi:hypothetical protein
MVRGDAGPAAAAVVGETRSLRALDLGDTGRRWLALKLFLLLPSLRLLLLLGLVLVLLVAVLVAVAAAVVVAVVGAPPSDQAE